MNKLFLLFAIVTSALLVSCEGIIKNDEGSESYSITLQPGPESGKDAFIEDYPLHDYRNLTWGDSDEFAAISWTSGGDWFVVRSFIDFNFDTIPDGVLIDSAKLSLYAYGNEFHGYGHDTLDGSNECYLQRVTSEWHEHSVTWNEQPQTTENNQIILPKSQHPMQDYVGIDITDLVRDIYGNPEESFGFMFRLAKEKDYRRMFFATSDAEEEYKRPKLEIYYTRQKN